MREHTAIALLEQNSVQYTWINDSLHAKLTVQDGTSTRNKWVEVTGLSQAEMLEYLGLSEQVNEHTEDDNMTNTTTINSTGFYEVPNYVFKMLLDTQQSLSTKIRKATTPAAELELTGKAYTDLTGDVGFAIQADGELVAVYSRG